MAIIQPPTGQQSEPATSHPRDVFLSSTSGEHIDQLAMFKALNSDYLPSGASACTVLQLPEFGEKVPQEDVDSIMTIKYGLKGQGWQTILTTIEPNDRQSVVTGDFVRAIYDAQGAIRRAEVLSEEERVDHQDQLAYLIYESGLVEKAIKDFARRRLVLERQMSKLSIFGCIPVVDENGVVKLGSRVYGAQREKLEKKLQFAHDRAGFPATTLY